jgi:hypothetical protein
VTRVGGRCLRSGRPGLARTPDAGLHGRSILLLADRYVLFPTRFQEKDVVNRLAKHPGNLEAYHHRRIEPRFLDGNNSLARDPDCVG